MADLTAQFCSGPWHASYTHIALWDGNSMRLEQ